MFLRTKNTDYAARFQTFNYTYSYREIASAIKGNIRFMWLSGGLQPDFRTINDFKGQKLKGSIEKRFSQLVEMKVDLELNSLKKPTRIDTVLFGKKQLRKI